MRLWYHTAQPKAFGALPTLLACLLWQVLHRCVESTAAGTDFNGQDLPADFEVPDVPQAFPPVRRDGGPGVVVLELIAPIADATLCQVQRDNGAGGGPAVVLYYGSCASLVRVDGLELDVAYQFWVRYLQTVTEIATGRTFEFEGPLSDPIRLVSAAAPSWGEDLPQIEVLGATTIKVWWNEPATGGAPISGYLLEMEKLGEGEGARIIYDGTNEWTVLQYIVQDLVIQARYRFAVYAMNSLGRSSPAYVTYSVPRPHTPDTFFPLRWDPSELAYALPAQVVADLTENLTVYARHPVTNVHEPVCSDGNCITRKFLASLHDACDLDVTRTICVPVTEHHPRYQDHRQRLEEPPACCMTSTDLGSELYSIDFTGRKTGFYSLMLQTLFPGGLVGQYWDNTAFDGEPFLVRFDPTISFDWEDGPITDLAGDMIAVRWTGFILAPSTESFTLYIDADDYVRLSLQGIVLIDLWETEHVPCCEQGMVEVNLTQGEYYMLQVEYMEVIGNASVELSWSASVTNFTRRPIDPSFLYRGAVLKDSPFHIEVRPGAASHTTSRLLNPPRFLTSGIKDRLWIEALDTARNIAAQSRVEFVANFVGPLNTNLTFTSSPLARESRWIDTVWVETQTVLDDHIHFIDYVLPYPGNYTLRVFLHLLNHSHQELWQSPFPVQVTADVLQPQMCVVFGSGAERFTAGIQTSFFLELRDAYGVKVSLPSDSVNIEVDIAWQDYIPQEIEVRDAHFVAAYSEWLSNNISVVPLEDGGYEVFYTAYRAGLNHLIVKVNGILIRGHRDAVGGNVLESPSDPPEGGLNEVIDIMGHFNPRADAVLSYILPEQRVTSCTTGVDCELHMQVRDAYGNRISEDRSSVVRILTFPAECDATAPLGDIMVPEETEAENDDDDDPYGLTGDGATLCLPVDEGECIHEANGTHECAMVPTVAGSFVLRLLVHNQDSLEVRGIYHTETVNLVDRTYFNVTRYIRGPWDINIMVGSVSMNTTVMEGPGLNVTGNVVGQAQPVIVQFKDQYENSHSSWPADFGTRYVPLRGYLGETELDISNNGDGTATVQVYTELAGWFRLVVQVGFGCIEDQLDDSFDNLELECEDISGSPSHLVYWAPSVATALGTTCELQYFMDAGSTYPFSCTSRDVYGNAMNDSSLWFNASFRLRDEPTSERLVFPATFSPPNATYTVEPTVLVSGTYSVMVDLFRNGGVMAWYHRGMGFNSLIETDPIGNLEGQLEGDDPIAFTRIDPGLGNFEPSEDELTVLDLRQFFTVVWQGFLLSNTSGEHVLHINCSGSLRIELEGLKIVDNLPNLAEGAIPQQTLMELPLELQRGRLLNTTVHYAHGIGPFWVKLGLSEGMDFGRVPTPLDDSQWFFMRTVRYAYMPGATLPGDPAIAVVSAIEAEVASTVEDDISVMTVKQANRFVLQTRDIFGNARTEPTEKVFEIYVKGPPRVERNNIEYINNGQYEVNMVPQSTGYTEMVLRIDGKEIYASPFTIYVQEQAASS